MPPHHHCTVEEAFSASLLPLNLATTFHNHCACQSFVPPAPTMCCRCTIEEGVPPPLPLPPFNPTPLLGSVPTAHFEGADVKLEPIQTFIPPKDGVFFLAFTNTSSDVGIYGNFVQSNYLIGFDLEAKPVSFKPIDWEKFDGFKDASTNLSSVLQNHRNFHHLCYHTTNTISGHNRNSKFQWCFC
ncbi:Xylanase inhibitor [Vigna unguiculata]|uniref:Xylanase inhibitor n=1 Tax=Vigna unguiculata TaxID=3917 RepID=A0A4D6LH12_VIGUN|nr:Xylanase inhibitor [Vigna unguiculata]